MCTQLYLINFTAAYFNLDVIICLNIFVFYLSFSICESNTYNLFQYRFKFDMNSRTRLTYPNYRGLNVSDLIELIR